MVTARNALASRAIPFMALSDGSSSSKTAPPAPIPSGLSPEQRAQLRFAVTGNAIVTGGAGVLGLAASRALLEQGLTGLALFDFNADILESVVTALQTEFPKSKIIGRVLDIVDDVAVTAAVEEASCALGNINTLLCFAGVVGCINALEMSATQWRRTLDINTTGSFLCAQAAAKQMVASGTGGSIVLTSSISGHRVNYPQPQAAYNVSKAGVLAMKNCLAAEWARYGIRVNSVSPGYMDTILNEGEGLREARETWAARNPMGRMGTPAELTGAVVLLASAAGTYINGADIVCDGGAIVF
ncbi:hypothetical protein V500_00932 [Pseudogymnoascus sp. VKM F-4518 (FW-2643)]|nr:hypothetical protein V500_00932 [Pseudogymnoascus sp. VKM F-4518 (FW-2643)]